MIGFLIVFIYMAKLLHVHNAGVSLEVAYKKYEAAIGNTEVDDPDTIRVHRCYLKNAHEFMCQDLEGCRKAVVQIDDTLVAHSYPRLLYLTMYLEEHPGETDEIVKMIDPVKVATCNIVLHTPALLRENVKRNGEGAGGRRIK